MQVLVAFAFDTAVDREVSARLDRVAAYYSPIWQLPVARQGTDLGDVGLYMWDAIESPWEWPAWQEENGLAVATVNHPLGYERLVGNIPAGYAPVAVAQAVLERPERVSEMTPPFVVAVLQLKASRVTLATDALGLGHLYQLRFPGGWVWSNRPAAAALFAGVRAAPDLTGWQTFAATGWFMGDHTPFERVFRVPAGTQVGFDAGNRGLMQRRIDFLGSWAATRQGDPLAADRLEETAEALKGVALSLAKMRRGPIVVGLSGGRDSRIAAAAFLSAGVEVELRTDASLVGEGTVARQLVAALPDRVVHRVHLGRAVKAAPGMEQEGPPTLERALGWHRYQEGMRSATFLPAPPPDGLGYGDFVSVLGLGEITHGTYYPPDLRAIETLPFVERFEKIVEHLVSKVVRRTAVSPQAQDAAAGQVRRVVAAAARCGLEDVKMFDYFYAAEKLRCWGSMEEFADLATPLLVPEFTVSAFDLTPRQRRENALQRAITALLIPAWAEVPYYQRPEGETLPMAKSRLAFAPDHERISMLLADPSHWGDGYEVPLVQQLWARLRSDGPDPRAEVTLQRVIWRATFSDFLAEVNQEDPPLRSQAAPLTSQVRQNHRPRRLMARALRRVARMVDGPTARSERSQESSNSKRRAGPP